MALAKTTSYAPDIYKALNGILLIYKPPRIGLRELVGELRERISDSLNQYEPRPIARRLSIQGKVDEEKQLVELPNLADHPLVVGPRYVPWELKIGVVRPTLGFRSSGISILLLGRAIGYYNRWMNRASFVSVYHITGKFGHITDNFFYDGNVKDKSTFKHIGTGRIDAALSRIESTQQARLFETAAVPLDSQEAYELAKSWPSRPPKMAHWPVIYRIRCIHLKLPEFKIEVTVANENENYLAQLSQDIGVMLKSGAYTESIRRVKFGPFNIDDSLTDKDWNLQSIVNNLSLNNRRKDEIKKVLYDHQTAMSIRTNYRPDLAVNKPRL